jgi:hypothetical protein
MLSVPQENAASHGPSYTHMARLTKRIVEAGKPRRTDYFIWCSVTPGFGRAHDIHQLDRFQPTCVRPFDAW